MSVNEDERFLSELDGDDDEEEERLVVDLEEVDEEVDDLDEVEAVEEMDALEDLPECAILGGIFVGVVEKQNRTGCPRSRYLYTR